MGLFSKKAKEIRTTVTALDMGGGDGFFHIVGESFHQDELRKIQRATPSDDLGNRCFTVALLPEPENQHDPNAIAVYAEGFGVIGHFARDDAARHVGRFRKLAKDGKAGFCRAMLIGEQHDTLGVVLDFKAENLSRH